jgi:hypothetical protein
MSGIKLSKYFFSQSQPLRVVGVKFLREEFPNYITFLFLLPLLLPLLQDVLHATQECPAFFSSWKKQKASSYFSRTHTVLLIVYCLLFFIVY